jgi:hypothetical protein
MAIDGKYEIVIDTPMGKQSATLTLTTTGEKLSGTADSAMGKSEFTGTVKGDAVAWVMDINSPMGQMKLEYTGKVTGNDIAGEVKIGSFGTAPFSGKKV